MSGMSVSAKRTYIVVGAIAAAVSAATVGYFVWDRSRRLTVAERDSVDALLERCHSQVRLIERRLGELSA
jgi:uncharacterized protein (DUF3084 family)